MRVGVYLLALLLLAAPLATPPASAEGTPTPHLVYEVVVFGRPEEACLSHECYLFVQVVGGNSSHLLVNVTFARGSLVRVRDFVFVRPREASSLLLAVDRRDWSAYANGVYAGRLPFYGLKPGGPAASLATAAGVVTLAAANATRVAVADRDYLRISVGNLTREIPTREYWPGLIDLLDALGVERLELYSAKLDGRVSLLFDPASGALCYLQALNYSEFPLAILKLLGVRGESVYLQLLRAAAARPPIALAEEAPVDPPERAPRAARFVPA
jgi:hypothetical protein